jgi:replicative superfamily II helicase
VLLLLLLLLLLLAAQAECLNQPDVLEGANLVYCAPTSGGKSMVAEVLMLRRLLSTGRPALLVRQSHNVLFIYVTSTISLSMQAYVSIW